MEGIYLKSYCMEDYYIPSELQEEFLYYTKKIRNSENIPDHIELYRGSIVAFNCRFKKYRAKFRIGQIWYKKTESWMGDDEKGSGVMICGMDSNFIFYKRSLFGQRYCLNKFSMLRIYNRRKYD